MLVLAAILAGLLAPAWAAEIAVVKGTDVDVRPIVEALRRSLAGHTISEYTVGDAASGLAAQLDAQGAIVVLLGPRAAELGGTLKARGKLAFALMPRLAGLEGLPGVLAGVPPRSQLALFRMVDPRLARIGVLHGPDLPPELLDELQKAAPGLRLVSVVHKVANEKEVPEALRSLLHGPEAVDALWIPPDPLLLGDLTRRFVLSECLKARKPVFSFAESLVQEGALASAGPDLASVGERLADIVRRLDAGESAARIGVLVPKGELVVNRKVAGSLQIQVPAEALAIARTVN
jgi:hypothetical protein